MPLLAPVTSAAEFSMAPQIPAKPAWRQAAAAFQPVRTPNFAERTVARHNPVTNTRRTHRRRSASGRARRRSRSRWRRSGRSARPLVRESLAFGLAGPGRGAGLNRCVIPVTATPELAARKMPLPSSWPRQQRPDIGCQFRVRQLAHCLWPAAGQPRHHRADTGPDPSPAPAVPAPRRLPEDSSR
jgi:hypothetical protein